MQAMCQSSSARRLGGPCRDRDRRRLTSSKGVLISGRAEFRYSTVPGHMRDDRAGVPRTYVALARHTRQGSAPSERRSAGERGSTSTVAVPAGSLAVTARGSSP